MNMRITGQTAMRRYVGNLQRNFYNKNLSENKITNNRKYTRASQSPLEAAKALKVRKAISENETYQSNLMTAAGIYDSAEAAVGQISSTLAVVGEKLIAGATGTFSIDDKQIFAIEIDELAKRMVSLMNLNVANRKIFGGVNNTPELQAYSIRDMMDYSQTPPVPVLDNNGYPRKEVLFNGIPVNTYDDPTDFPFGQSSFIDVGLGLGWDDEYTVDPQTGIPVTFNGAEILGSGINDKESLTYYTFDSTALTNFSFTFNGNTYPTVSFTDLAAFQSSLPAGVQAVQNGDMISIRSTDKNLPLSDVTFNGNEVTPTVYNEFPKNIIQLTLDASNAVRNGNNLEIMAYHEQIFQSLSYVSMSIAKIGSNQAFIEFNQERLINNMESLLDQQNTLERPDLGEEITNQKVFEAIYNATLQMSAATIPMSIFNFIR